MTLALLFAVLLSFSGAFLLVWMVTTGHKDGLLYGALSLVLIVNTTLLALYHFDEFVLYLAAHPAEADGLIAAVVALKLAAKATILALLVGNLVQPGGRRPWLWGSVPVGWVILALLPLPAWVGELVYLGACAVLVWRLWPGPLAAYFPLKALVVLIDALAPPGLSPLWGAALDLGFFLGLNLALHRWVLGGAAAGSLPLAGEWGTFNLSPRERETAALLAGQLSYKDIAARLFVSVETVKSHAKAVYRKTGCRNRQELARKAGIPPGSPPEFTPVHHGKTPPPGGNSGWRQE